jgi:endonuclease/exonuclease/phosphatase family metal-dependent hydrolase
VVQSVRRNAGGDPLRQAFCFAALAALVLVAPSVAQDAPEQIRVVTYNVKNLRDDTAQSRVAALVDTLERLDADMIFLQEVANRRAVDRVRKELNRRQTSRYESHVADQARLDQEVVLLTRYAPTRFRRWNFPGLSVRLDRAVYADFEIAGTPLRVVAAHLKAGIRNYDDARTRNRQVRSLVSGMVRPALDQGRRIVILGDFNDLDDQVRYPNGRRPHGASQVFSTLRRRVPELRNLDGDLPLSERVSSRMGYMYDHVVVDRRLPARIAVDRSRQLAEWASDHWPVYCDIVVGADPVRESAEPGLLIRDGQSSSDTIYVSEAGKIQREVSVRVYLTHARPQDLELRLEHRGQTVKLAARGELPSGRSADRRLLVRGFQGKLASGAWKLVVRHRGSAVGGGTLRRWEIVAAAK